jgi:hypothetical protein
MIEASYGTYPKPPHGWTCYHCGETFTVWGAAEDHFGKNPSATPACLIKVGEELGLVMALRKAEALAEEYASRMRIAEDQVEVLEGQLSDFQRVTKFRDAQEVRNHLDVLEGRRITHDVVIDAFREKAPEIFAEVIG